jgi:hypothetical protein
VFNQ